MCSTFKQIMAAESCSVQHSSNACRKRILVWILRRSQGSGPHSDMAGPDRRAELRRRTRLKNRTCSESEALPSSHREVRDGVVVGLEDLGVIEDLVSECVEPVQGHSDVGGRHPVLQQTQHGCCVRHTRANRGTSPANGACSYT